MSDEQRWFFIKRYFIRWLQFAPFIWCTGWVFTVLWATINYAAYREAIRKQTENPCVHLRDRPETIEANKPENLTEQEREFLEAFPEYFKTPKGHLVCDERMERTKRKKYKVEDRYTPIRPGSYTSKSGELLDWRVREKMRLEKEKRQNPRSAHRYEQWIKELDEQIQEMIEAEKKKIEEEQSEKEVERIINASE